ncbi:MAG: hypothetical protein EOQ64_15215 [Mesorhizobium sp.]|uniref:hypothetical protein n=1 Tax=Mesorhizobium sp. TaxID=1871066 RepID=UPI000FE559E3|nr:hypothetical protein [Mesorhizobium sp.]RWG55921.1 MAG: hypothetical protein EOQ64_15215 [Mesorhizobium sp.]RWH40574.1 MAG: hypothetical protein EOQ78_20860 [Mesorhizobium sp.]RWI19480.1 MAG: hypothetical protein EOQ94_21055 [Mesorhizobium sp.]
MTPKALAEARKRVLAEKGNVTGKVSDISRFIAFGLLAVFYTIESGDGSFAKALQSQALFVYLIGVLASISILFDYLQYFCGVKIVERALKDPLYEYDDKSVWYWGRQNLFEAKQYLVLTSSALLVFVIGLAFFAKAAAQSL